MSAETSSADANRGGWLRWLALALVVGAVALLVMRRGFDDPMRGHADGPPPSIVFLLVDTLRADYVGAYGFQGEVSPNLDRLAGESILFDNAFSQAPWTKPSIASLFTSLHPEQHGVVAHRGRFGRREGEDRRANVLPRRAITLAELLRGAGYETAAFVANPWIQRGLGFAQGFETFDAKDSGNDVPATILFEKARAWLAGRDPARPFFLYIHLMDVHGPYASPRADYDALLGSPGLGEPRTLTEKEAAGRRGYALAGRGFHGDPMTLDAWRTSYAAGVRNFDRHLGRFLDELAQDGILDEVVLVVTSDHGEELADHGAWDHGGALYDEQIHVPLLIRPPGGVSGGRRVERVVSLVDLMPTLGGIAGAKLPRKIAGRDLGPVLRGRRLDGPEAAYASGVKWRPGVRAVRTRDRKLIRGGDGPTVAFEVDVDPKETRVLEGDAAVTDLSTLLDHHEEVLRAGPRFAPQARKVGAETQEKLRALGYLEASPSPGREERATKGHDVPPPTDSTGQENTK